jgi:hypothetical protein
MSGARRAALSLSSTHISRMAAFAQWRGCLLRPSAPVNYRLQRVPGRSVHGTVSQIFGVFEPDGQPERVVADAGGVAFVGANDPVDRDQKAVLAGKAERRCEERHRVSCLVPARSTPMSALSRRIGRRTWAAAEFRSLVTHDDPDKANPDRQSDARNGIADRRAIVKTCGWEPHRPSGDRRLGRRCFRTR